MDADVIIVGFGPVGQALAGLLGRAGHRVIVVERFEEPYGLPRAIRLDGEAMRLFQRLGITDAVQADAVPVDHYLWYGADRELIVDLDRSIPHPSGWASDWLFFQPSIEKALIAAAEEPTTVEVLRGRTVTAVAQDESGVEVTVAQWPAASGTARTLRARYLVGADGANSTVREAVDIGWEDLGFAEHWLVCDVRPRDEAVLERYPPAAQFCEPARPHAAIRNGRHHRRWEFQLLPGENPEEFTKDESRAWDLLAGHIAPDEGTIIRLATYQFRSLLARGMHKGRVFLAGDAAHLMPPFMGEGMCSGLRDASNLAWKLDQVLAYGGPEALLDTYGPERSGQNEAAVRMSLMMGQVSCTLDPEAAAGRDEAFRAGTVPPPPELPGLATGLVRQDSEGAPCPPAGTQSVQGLVADSAGKEGRFDDVVGRGFSLILRDGPPEAVLSKEHMAFLDDIGTATVTLGGDGPRRIRDLDGRLTAWMDDLALHAILVRPDFYVFGAAAHDADVATLVDDLRSQLWIRTEPSRASALGGRA